MKHLITSAIVLLPIFAMGCATDTPSEDNHPSTVDEPGSTITHERPSSSDVQVPDQLQPHISTPRVRHQFPNGCIIDYWCHNDNAAHDDSGFCIVNQCNGTAPGQFANLCSSVCSIEACSFQTNFGACG